MKKRRLQLLAQQEIQGNEREERTKVKESYRIGSNFMINEEKILKHLLGHKIGTDIRPVYTSRKIKNVIKVLEKRPPIVNQQCV